MGVERRDIRAATAVADRIRLMRRESPQRRPLRKLQERCREIRPRHIRSEQREWLAKLTSRVAAACLSAISQSQSTETRRAGGLHSSEVVKSLFPHVFVLS